MYFLLWLVLIVASPFASWWIARKLTSVPKWLQWALIPLLWAAALAAIYLFFEQRWSFTIPGLTTVAYFAAVLAAIVPLYLIWNLTRDLLPPGLNIVIAVALAGATLFYIFAKHRFIDYFAFLLLLFSTQPTHTLGKGSISPTLSYQMESSFFMGERKGYEIYRHPRWFPLVHKWVGSAPMDCPKNFVFSTGPDSHSVSLSCKIDDKIFPIRHVRID
jgi:hypothetical protein